MKIAIVPELDVWTAWDLHDATHIISIRDPGRRVDLPPMDDGKVLILEMEDWPSAGTPREVSPGAAQVKKIADFADGMDDNASVVVHCRMGHSRSPAAAIILLARRMDGCSAAELEAAVLDLWKTHPTINPNQHLLAAATSLFALPVDLVQLSARIRGQKLYSTSGNGIVAA